MRRAAPPLPISPKLLKHFAAVTLVLTASIAMFADGESREAITSQVDMRTARNQLLETEAEKLGTKKLKAHLTIKDNRRAYLPFADEGQTNEFGAEGGGAGGGSGSGARGPRRPGGPGGPAHMEPGKFDVRQIPKLPMTPGASITVRGATADELPGPQVRSGNRPKRQGSIRPTAKQMADIKQASRERTRSADGGD